VPFEQGYSQPARSKNGLSESLVGAGLVRLLLVCLSQLPSYLLLQAFGSQNLHIGVWPRVVLPGGVLVALAARGNRAGGLSRLLGCTV
jgi:hypothetical protein